MTRRRGAFRISGREEGRHRAALGNAAQGGPLRSDRVHHRPDIVHPLLQGRQAIERNAIGETGAAFVEENEPRKRREAAQEIWRTKARSRNTRDEKPNPLRRPGRAVRRRGPGRRC